MVRKQSKRYRYARHLTPIETTRFIFNWLLKHDICKSVTKLIFITHCPLLNLIAPIWLLFIRIWSYIIHYNHRNLFKLSLQSHHQFFGSVRFRIQLNFSSFFISSISLWSLWQPLWRTYDSSEIFLLGTNPCKRTSPSFSSNLLFRFPSWIVSEFQSEQ